MDVLQTIKVWLRSVNNEGTLLGQLCMYPFSCIWASIRVIFMKLHTSHSPHMECAAVLVTAVHVEYV